MIYGATGYTGRMAAEHAKVKVLKLVLAGRRPQPLADLASALGAEPRVFDLAERGAINRALSDVSVLLNCAGPYLRTAKPLMDASITSGVHYLDIAAELDSYRLAEEYDRQAAAAQIMLLPGCGGSVAMLGCLASHTAKRVRVPRKIAVALHVSGSMSRGSAISASENLTTETLVRADHRLVRRNGAEMRTFDFGRGPVTCFPVTLPDLITIARNTAVADVETFVHVSGSAFPAGDLSALPDGPSEQERKANRYQAVAEVTGEDGSVVRSILDTVNGYSFTPQAAAEAARRVLAGEIRPGFQTPAGLFGDSFAETIADTRLIDY
jgi:short subunit dehydrogenase-like uncharacterized protein